MRMEPLFNPMPLAPTVRDIGGRFVIEWPDPRPAWFPITAEAFEGLIESVNDARNALESEDTADGN